VKSKRKKEKVQCVRRVCLCVCGCPVMCVWCVYVAHPSPQLKRQGWQEKTGEGKRFSVCVVCVFICLCVGLCVGLCVLCVGGSS